MSVLDGINYNRNLNTITPELDYSGDLIVQVIVTDGADCESALYHLTITVIDLPEFPYFISNPPDSNIAVGHEYIYDILAGDTDSEQLSFSLIPSTTAIPSWISLEDNEVTSAILSGTPAIDNIGEYYSFSIIVEDNEANSDTQRVPIKVLSAGISLIAGPNPYDPEVDGNMLIQYTLLHDKNWDRIKFFIIDIAGDVVWMKKLDSSPYHGKCDDWDGTNLLDEDVANGAYLVIMEAKENNGDLSQKMFKIAVLRGK